MLQTRNLQMHVQHSTMSQTSSTTTFFWERTAPLLKHDGIERSTMMGFPCLRINGDFFVSAEPKTGDLIAKLPAKRVQAMIDEGSGYAFAPAGRRFKEWVRVSDRDAGYWDALLIEALNFVSKK